uniref:EamA domain-containing protein n=1 Tax=Entomoneis paludosa TaxID=265537 RepID=A0A7S2YCF8_9STRA
MLLGVIACVYGTNFPLGSLLDHALPASGVCTLRFGLAALALSPYLGQLQPSLWPMAVGAGCFTATGYICQAVALALDTPPATVSFLGAAVVLWCPFLEFALDRKPSGWSDRPQTYMAGALCVAGVGVLELCSAASGASGGELATTTAAAVTHGHMGDFLALLQAMGFGTGIYLSEKLMHGPDNADEITNTNMPNQALPITSVLVATTAVVSLLWWTLTDGLPFVSHFLTEPSGGGGFFLSNHHGMSPSLLVNNLLHDPTWQMVALALLWTGLISTSLNFGLEVFALGRVPSGEASVLLASEPLWAALFGALLLGETFGWNDYVGGLLIVTACLVNSIPTTQMKHVLGMPSEQLDVDQTSVLVKSFDDSPDTLIQTQEKD